MRRSKPLSLFVTVAVTLVVGAEAPAVAGVPLAAPATRAVSPHYGPAVPEQRPRPARTVALTFDDGPSPYTPEILAVLRRNHVPATFCMLGDNVVRHPRLARAVVREGHRLCNHSRSHADLATLPKAKVKYEVAVAQAQIHAATGVTPELFRFPYGSSDPQARKVVRRAGLRALSWDVDPQDWRRPKARKITRRVVGHVGRHSVVLMHDGGGDRSHTAASLDATIKQLRKRGYRFVLP